MGKSSYDLVTTVAYELFEPDMEEKKQVRGVLVRMNLSSLSPIVAEGLKVEFEASSKVIGVVLFDQFISSYLIKGESNWHLLTLLIVEV